MESIRVLFKKDYVHPWMLSYYIDRFSTQMARLELCIQISLKLAIGIDPRKLYFIRKPRNLWGELEEPAYLQLPSLSKKLEQPIRREKSSFGEEREEPQLVGEVLIPLMSAQGEIRNDFFRYLTRVRRPEILIAIDDVTQSIFDIYSENFLKVRSINFRSPGDMILEVGSVLAEAIHEIIYGHRREKRDQEQHADEIKKKKLETESLKQEVLSKVLDNIMKMREMGIREPLEMNLRETIQKSVEGIDTLNAKTETILELLELGQLDR